MDEPDNQPPTPADMNALFDAATRAVQMAHAAVAQAQVGRSFGKAEAKAFGQTFGSAARLAITPGKAFPLLGEAQKQTMGASLPERQRFKKAGTALEEASKLCVALPAKCGFD